MLNIGYKRRTTHINTVMYFWIVFSLSVEKKKRKIKSKKNMAQDAYQTWGHFLLHYFSVQFCNLTVSWLGINTVHLIHAVPSGFYFHTKITSCVTCHFESMRLLQYCGTYQSRGGRTHPGQFSKTAPLPQWDSSGRLLLANLSKKQARYIINMNVQIQLSFYLSNSLLGSFTLNVEGKWRILSVLH